MSLPEGGIALFELAGLLTHLGVLGIGLGGLVGLVALPRVRRSGLALVLMAVSMLLLVAWPRWRIGPELATAAAHVGLFSGALWLLIGSSARSLQQDTREYDSASYMESV